MQKKWPSISKLVVLAFLFGVLNIPQAFGQGQPPFRPGDVQPDLPKFKSPSSEDILPQVPIPKGKDTEGLIGGVRIFIKVIQVSGNTILSDTEIEAITKPYTNRKVSLTELEKLRDDLTRAYVDRGYINSGAVIPDQKVQDGVFRYEIVEGKLTEVRIKTDGRFRESYFTSRLMRDADEPLNIKELEHRLQLLQMDSRVQKIEAKLNPTETKGGSQLTAEIKENKPLTFGININNYQPPTVGDFRGQIFMNHANVLGYGDNANFTYSGSEGFEIVEGGYAIPVTSYDTLLQLNFRHSWSRVLEEPFNTLDITSTAMIVGATLSHPLIKSINQELSLFISGEFKRAQTFLFGNPFSFINGPDSGLTKVMALRFGQDYIRRSREQVFAARSTFSFGLDAMEATKNAGNVPDGQFFSWLGQFQFARRLPILNSQIVLRGDVLLTDSPLLGLEQFSVGGHSSVRGYRENQLVNDNGITGSIEFRVPVWSDPPRASFIELAAFSDIGRSWQEVGPTMGIQTLSSVGVGVRFGVRNFITAQAYWGHPFRDMPESTDRELQDEGVHFNMSMIIN